MFRLPCGISRTLSVLLIGGFVTLSIQAVYAQNETATRKRMQARKAESQAPKLDGRLDDAVWRDAEFVSAFAQKEPNEGEPAANRSEVAIVYDDDALYIGARLHSVDPDNILATVSRRDNSGNSERIIVSLDTYNNRRTAYSFAVTESGTRVDYYHSSDSEGDRDYDFDPVWTAKTARTADGWSAEMRIPFTQLRFNNTAVQTWGVNMNRWVPTTNEDSYWIVVPKDETGWASRMGELVGIEAISASRRVEFTPYAASDATVRTDVDADDPFTDKTNYNGRVGADFKMGVGPNLTLEGTVNPDFGQVEADPAEVNLSAFETFFSERRPFFTEGSDLLDGGGAGYFYSRRIGAPPHFDPDIDFVDQPQNTSILGAAKLTGRLNSGLSVGVLGAVTEKESADTFKLPSEADRVTVEPLTGFGVVRLQQEFGKDQSTAGIIVTGVERDVQTDANLSEILRKRAYTGGGDFNLRFNGGEYELEGNAGMSYIEGSPDAIESAQRSSARYFQRPDADYVELDPTRKSLTGWTAGLELEKEEGDWVWGVGGNAESPEFELNDAGRLSSADDIDTWSGLRYRQNTPGSWYQNYWIGTWLGSGWNFGGDRQYTFLDFESYITFKSFYGFWMSAEYFPAAQSDNRTRGGPSMATEDFWNFDVNFWSHNKGRASWWVFGSYDGDDLGSWNYTTQGGVTFRPGTRWELSLSTNWRHIKNARQYVDTVEDSTNSATFGNRYIFSWIERSQLSTQLRLNYAFTPDFTLEAYAEPFSASGRYFDHGELAAPRTNDLRTYGSDGTTITPETDDTYTVNDGADTFSVENLDFNFVSFRSNLVLRWEWNPGSTLFIVWQQDRSGFEERGDLIGVSSIGDAISSQGDNFFAIKMTYWLPFL